MIAVSKKKVPVVNALPLLVFKSWSCLFSEYIRHTMLIVFVWGNLPLWLIIIFLLMSLLASNNYLWLSLYTFTTFLSGNYFCPSLESSIYSMASCSYVPHEGGTLATEHARESLTANFTRALGNAVGQAQGPLLQLPYLLKSVAEWWLLLVPFSYLKWSLV